MQPRRPPTLPVLPPVESSVCLLASRTSMISVSGTNVTTTFLTSTDESPSNVAVAYNYPVPIASFLVQNLGDTGAIVMLVLMYIVTLNCTAACMMSGSRITYAVSRDGVLPGSTFLHHMGPNKLPNRCVYTITILGIVLSLPILGSTVAFQALASSAT
ncbi:hypothetical protein HDU93_002670, partial [Gonapodya sp. JEL0774]